MKPESKDTLKVKTKLELKSDFSNASIWISRLNQKFNWKMTFKTEMKIDFKFGFENETKYNPWN